LGVSGPSRGPVSYVVVVVTVVVVTVVVASVGIGPTGSP
jgi:hypothetical protein